LNGPVTNNKPDSNCFKKTTLLPLNLPANTINIVPGVIEALNLVPGVPRYGSSWSASASRRYLHAKKGSKGKQTAGKVSPNAIVSLTKSKWYTADDNKTPLKSNKSKHNGINRYSRKDGSQSNRQEKECKNRYNTSNASTKCSI